MNFYDKLNGAIAQNQSLLFVGLDPHPEMLPERYSQKSHPNTMIVSTFKNTALEDVDKIPAISAKTL
jgi:orotidine-5'-phosphate decarboxylase